MSDPILSVAPSSALESQYLEFVITLSEPVTELASVDYHLTSTGGGLLVDVLDITNAILGTVTFAPGSDSATIRVLTVGSILQELDKLVTLSLFNADGVSFGDNVQNVVSTGWVLDNGLFGNSRAMAISGPVVSESAGGEAVFTISLSEAFSDARSFSFSTSDGTARAGADYVAASGTVTFLAGQTTATVAVALIDDAIGEGTETFSLAVTGAHGVVGAAASATVVDDDTALPVISIEGGVADEATVLSQPALVYRVRLSETSDQPVSVAYTTLSGTGTPDVDALSPTDALSGTLTFAAGETVKTIVLHTAIDGIDELDESIIVQLSNPVGARFGTNRHDETAIGWVLDNDGSAANRAIEVSDIAVTEGAGGKAVFILSLSQPFNTERSFTYTTKDGSALAGSDYVARSGSITFTAGQIEAVVEVDLLNERSAEAGERFDLIVDAAHGVAGASGTALILDDDTRRPTVTIDDAAITEGNYLIHTVRLSEQSDTAVTVDYTTLDGAAVQGGDLAAGTSTLSGTLTFAPGQTTQQIVLEAVADSTDELDESYLIRLHDPVGASFGGNNGSLTATGWVLDDDGVGLNRTVSLSDAELREGPGNRVAVFAVTISTPSDAPLTLAFETVDGTATAGIDFAARSGEIAFEPGQTRVEIAVPIKNNLALEENEQFSLRVIPPFPTQLSSSASTAIGTATILDGTLRGTDGGNRLTGTSYADRIEGFGGNDVISGRGGNDILSGGGANDRIFGDAGRDRLLGGSGRDLLDGGAGRDTLAGGNGNDRYVIDALDVISESRTGGIDSVDARHAMALGANLENLRLLGSANLRGNGNDLDNALTGNAGRNALAGRDGNDRLAGATGNDTLKGGDGRDLLRGDAGKDLMYGGVDGADRDVFVFRSTAHSAVGSARDRVYDFRSGVDDIDLRGIDANENRGGNQAFDFSGRQADDYSVWIVRSGANVIVSGDTDGDARADFEILVAGNTRLAEADFLL